MTERETALSKRWIQHVEEFYTYIYITKKKKEGINHKRRETEMISMHIQGTPKEETSMCSAVICVSVWVYEIKKLVWMG